MNTDKKQCELDSMFNSGVDAAEIARFAMSYGEGKKEGEFFYDKSCELLVELIAVVRKSGKTMADVRYSLMNEPIEKLRSRLPAFDVVSDRLLTSFVLMLITGLQTKERASRRSYRHMSLKTILGFHLLMSKIKMKLFLFTNQGNK